MGFSCHCLCQKCLAGSRRAHQKRAFWELCADSRILSRIMKEIYHFLERFLGFILPCYILKGNSCLLLDIGLGSALAYASHHSSAFVHTAEQPA